MTSRPPTTHSLPRPRAAGLRRAATVVLLMAALAGCQTPGAAVPCVEFMPAARVPTLAAGHEHGYVPPAPAFASPATVATAGSSVGQPERGGGPALGPAAPATIGPAQPTLLPLAASQQLAPGALAGAPEVAEPSAGAALETRLAALEAACRERDSTLEELHQRDAQQTQLLQQVATTLTTSHGELSHLQQSVRTQHQQDLDALQQLSRTLQQLIESEPASADGELD